MEDQPRDEDMTVDEDGKNECSRSDMTTPTTSSPRLMRGSTKKSRPNSTWFPKKAEVIISTKLREVPCDRCQMKG